jgi:hypothetical protein
MEVDRVKDAVDVRDQRFKCVLEELGRECVLLVMNDYLRPTANRLDEMQDRPTPLRVSEQLASLQLAALNAVVLDRLRHKVTRFVRVDCDSRVREVSLRPIEKVFARETRFVAED